MENYLLDSRKDFLSPFSIVRFPDNSEHRDFTGWRREEHNILVNSVLQFGRGHDSEVISEVAKLTKKQGHEIKIYLDTFWAYGFLLPEWSTICTQLEKGEKERIRVQEIDALIHRKISSLQNPAAELRLSYGSNRGLSYSIDEDIILIMLMHRYGYGQWDKYRQDIMSDWRFCFDWFIKANSSDEIKRRCDYLVTVLRKEEARQDVTMTNVENYC